MHPIGAPIAVVGKHRMGGRNGVADFLSLETTGSRVSWLVCLYRFLSLQTGEFSLKCMHVLTLRNICASIRLWLDVSSETKVDNRGVWPDLVGLSFILKRPYLRLRSLPAFDCHGVRLRCSGIHRVLR